MVLVFQGFSLGITFLLIFQSAYLTILTDIDFLFCFLAIQHSYSHSAIKKATLLEGCTR